MYTILIIEDEPRVASLLMNGLEENGYQTMVAYDGLMGLRLFQTHTFDLVISDIVLPKMDGFELAKEIRQFKSVHLRQNDVRYNQIECVRLEKP